MNYSEKEKTSINNFIEKKIKTTNINVNTITNSDIYEIEDNEQIDILEKEFTLKSKLNLQSYPKNYGNLWTEKERKKILKSLGKNNHDINKESDLFDNQVISDIARLIERTEYGVKEEIKKMIFNDYLKGFDYKEIGEKFNIPESNIKMLIKIYLDKNGKKIINQIETENKILQLHIDNVQLKKKIKELNNN